MQCKSAKHASWHSVHHINVLIARTVATDLERGDGVPKGLFKMVLRPEREPANGGVQAVCPDYQAKPANSRVLELHLQAIVSLLESENLAFENDLGGVSHLFEKQARKVAAPIVT